MGAGYPNRMRSDGVVGAPASQLVKTAGARMPTPSMVSVVEDDQFFRDSMRRLMRSLGYDVAAFSILAITLIFMPSGILGRPEIEKV